MWQATGRGLAMLERIRQWYHGTTTMHEGRQFKGGVVMPHWTTHYSRSALVARRLVAFWQAYWQFLITTVLAVAALVVGYLALP